MSNLVLVVLVVLVEDSLRITKVFRIHKLGTTDVHTKYLPVHLVDVEIFDWINENCNLLFILCYTKKGQAITKVIIIHLLGTMDIF